jgi:hypothetical protein
VTTGEIAKKTDATGGMIAKTMVTTNAGEIVSSMGLSEEFSDAASQRRTPRRHGEAFR